jgi:hypothetical protein
MTTRPSVQQETRDLRRGRRPTPACSRSSAGDAVKALGLDEDDRPHWAGLDVEAARWLADAPILGVGVDCIGTDAAISHGFDPPHPAHHYLHGAGKFGMSLLAKLDRLPAAEVSEPTTRKWAKRYRSEGEAGLLDRPSAAHCVHNRTAEERTEAILALGGCASPARRSPSSWRCP